jgi:hypothetical protein
MQASNPSTSGAAAASPATSTPSTTPAVKAPSACDIPAFCRSYFYTGKLLTEGDLNRDQKYMIDKLRLHYVALHGWGVACGLMVQPHPQCPDRFVVTAGFAVDDCGREVRLTTDCVVMFPRLPQTPPDPCRPEPDSYEERHETSHHKAKSYTYYVCIRYNEGQEDFMPVVFADCCGTAKQPNRVCECAAIDLLTEPPACLQEMEHRKHPKHSEDCHKILEHLPEKCPTSAVCCIPLAVIRDYVSGEPFTEAMIDNSIRRMMPSVARLEEAIRCLTEYLPKPATRLTHIARYHWDHDREYAPREFQYEFVGTHESPRGFEIEFDRRVHAAGLSNRTFQAMIVREPPERHEPRHPEIAPARVMRSEDGRRCTLHIDPEYARRHLDNHDFDVIITLHCDKVIDEHGMPVDGNLLGGLRGDEEQEYTLRHPTGDGIPGGLFESWIRVRRER